MVNETFFLAAGKYNYKQQFLSFSSSQVLVAAAVQVSQLAEFSLVVWHIQFEIWNRDTDMKPS